MQVRFYEITETPGIGASEEQYRMLATRYGLAARECIGGRVLEIACGTGIGLGFLAKVASDVLGIDVDPLNVDCAAKTYKGHPKVTIKGADAQRLPVDDGSIDCIVCFEAIYYFENVPSVLRECRRVLRSGGTVVLCSVNPEWSGFVRSPYFTKYWKPWELDRALREAGFEGRFWWAFQDRRPSGSARLVAVLRSLARRLNLIPRSMRGKALLKRMFYGASKAMPTIFDERLAEAETLHPFSPDSDKCSGKVYYVVVHPTT